MDFARSQLQEAFAGSASERGKQPCRHIRIRTRRLGIFCEQQVTAGRENRREVGKVRHRA